MQTISKQEGRVSLFALLLLLFVAALAYWFWRAHTQVSMEIGLACSQLTAEACATAEARYLDSLLAAWLAQMFPWVLPFIPAFIYVFFFRWLRKNRDP